MNDQSFSLQPFSPLNPLLSLKITGNIGLRSNTLAIRYALLGPLTKLVIPTQANNPARMSGLWQETCFELFLAVKHSPDYWEFNLSPAGHWNVYRFAAYRQGMQEEKGFPSLPFRVQSQSDSLLLDLELDLAKIVQPDQPLEVALSAVIKFRDGEMTYWALTHRGQQADFHRRDGFIVELSSF